MVQYFWLPRSKSSHLGHILLEAILLTPAKWVNRIRQNHAVEHATIHVLSQRHLNIKLLGRSDLWGFYLFGQVSPEEVASAAIEGLSRLQRGEAGLAVHPRCGTNLAVGGLLAGAFSAVGFVDRERSKWVRAARVVLATMAALLVAQPLGLLAQRYLTTTPDMSGVRLDSVMRQNRGRVPSYRVKIRHDD